MTPTIRFVLYVAALAAAVVATVLAFRWFGTDDPGDWPGWTSGALALWLLSGLPAWPRRGREQTS